MGEQNPDQPKFEDPDQNDPDPQYGSLWDVISGKTLTTRDIFSSLCAPIPPPSEAPPPSMSDKNLKSNTAKHDYQNI